MDQLSLVLDYRTNIHHTLKKKPMVFEDLVDFIECYKPVNRHKRKATWDEQVNLEGRWRSFSYEELRTRDRTSLDLFWLKDKSLTIWTTCRHLTIWRRRS